MLGANFFSKIVNFILFIGIFGCDSNHRGVNDVRSLDVLTEEKKEYLLNNYMKITQASSLDKVLRIMGEVNEPLVKLRTVYKPSAFNSKITAYVLEYYLDSEKILSFSFSSKKKLQKKYILNFEERMIPQ